MDQPKQRKRYVMPKTNAKRHTHKYHKVNGLWMCALPDCTHFMPKNVAANIVGKNSICWMCVEPFILTPNLLDEDKPMCAACRVKSSNFLEFLENKDKEIKAKEVQQTLPINTVKDDDKIDFLS